MKTFRNREIDIMGIVNLTDNSYFGQSRCLCGDDYIKSAVMAVTRAGQLIGEGASIIDFGACSTRPGSDPVGEEEEWRRLEPALMKMAVEYPNTRLSIDTWWASVISNAFDLLSEIWGKDKTAYQLIINDISAGEDDPSMLPLVGKLGLEYIAMHKRGNAKTMQDLCEYDDVVSDVLEYFETFARKAKSYGIVKWVLDPGFGFAKTVEQNYRLLEHLDTMTSRFAPQGVRTLVGVSRKSMIYKKFDITPEESLPQTQVLHMKALQCGADILRVHDVSEAARTVELYRMLG